MLGFTNLLLIVFAGVGPCLPNPCQNQGTCNPDPFADIGYTCSCLPAFSGVNCQLGKNNLGLYTQKKLDWVQS